MVPLRAQVEVRRSDVQSAWSGLRPLAMDPNATDTASACRDHIVTRDPDGLITVTGRLLSKCAADHQESVEVEVRDSIQVGLHQLRVIRASRAYGMQGAHGHCAGLWCRT